jgi:hypothetical protein
VHSVTNKRLWVITGVVGAAALAAAPALTATAYPPSKKLTAVASIKSGAVSVSLGNTQSGCVYQLQSRGIKINATGTGGAQDVPFPVGTKTGQYTITVHSTGSGCTGPNENAVTKIGVTAYKVAGGKSVKAGQRFTVKAGGWSSESSVSFVLSGGGKTITSAGVTPNEDGDASHTFTAPTKSGTYLVTVVQGTATQSHTVVVSGKVTQVSPKPKPKPKPKPTTKPKPKTTKPSTRR